MRYQKANGLPFAITLTVMAIVNLGAVPALGMFAPPDSVPIDRLVMNLSGQVKKSPDSAEAHYSLGRAHYMAVVLRSGRVGIYQTPGDGKKLPTIADKWLQEWGLKRDRRYGDAPPAEELSPKQLVHHHAHAIEHLTRAIELAPDQALYHLTLASAYEQGEAALQAAAKTRPAKKDKPEQTRKAMRLALQRYKRAFELAIEKDLAREHLPIEGMKGMVSHEAAAGYLRLAEQVKDVEQKQVARVRAKLKKLKMTPRGGVTPVIFSLDGGKNIDDLLAEQTTVAFDLDGTGGSRHWPWVEPDTGILVWDPHQTGRIRSGRDLFGSVSWWLFWDTGYDALAALDDNDDGKLTGAELNGIAGWFDRDQDGTSDTGEVTPVRDLEIKAIEVAAEGKDGRHPTNPTGMLLENGRTAPTWDWIAKPMQSTQ